MKNKTRKFLLSIGCCIPLILNDGCYNLNTPNKTIKNEKTIEELLNVPKSVGKFARNLKDSPLNDKPVLVRLSRNVDTYVVTSKNGYHLNILANKGGIEPIDSNREYSNYDIGFYSLDDRQLRKLSIKLDKDKNKVISLDELSGF